MRVFLSSTIHDLKDLRNVVQESLSAEGYFVLASESGTIPVDSRLHSYEICLRAAETCDCLVVIIDGRFGGTLPDGRSITQAEFETALDAGKRVLVFVRRSVMEAPEHHRKDLKAGRPMEPNNIVRDVRVLTFIEGVRRRINANWIFEFDKVSELLKILHYQLGEIKPHFVDGRYQKTYRVAMLPKGERLTFWDRVKSGAVRAASDSGSIDLKWDSEFRENDWVAQNSAIQHYIDRGYDGICLAAIHRQYTQKGIVAAGKANIPVLLYDSGLDDASRVISYVASDNRVAGQHAAFKAAEILGNRGRVAIMAYNSGCESTESREEGFRETLSRFPGIEMVEEGLQISDDPRVVDGVVNSVLERTRDEERIDLIFTPIEPGTTGILRALRGRPPAVRPHVIAFDPTPEALDALREGLISALVVQDAHQIGYAAVQALRRYLQGLEVPRLQTIPCTLVTRDNIDLPSVSAVLQP